VARLNIVLNIGEWTLAEGKFFREYTGKVPRDYPSNLDDSAVVAALVYIGTKRVRPNFGIKDAEAITYEEAMEVTQQIIAAYELAHPVDEDADEEEEPMPDPSTAGETSP
jgi:hypothetical protein